GIGFQHQPGRELIDRAAEVEMMWIEHGPALFHQRGQPADKSVRWRRRVRPESLAPAPLENGIEASGEKGIDESNKVVDVEAGGPMFRVHFGEIAANRVASGRRARDVEAPDHLPAAG